MRKALLFASLLAVLACVWVVGNVWIFPSERPQDAPPLIETHKQDTKKLTKKDRIDLAIEHEVAITRDPATGRVPKERLLDVHQYLARRPSELESRAAVSGITWDERGPNNVAGRTRSILVDQGDGTGNTLWAASVGGGLWKTTNINVNPPTWTVVSDTFMNIAGTALAQDPTNFNTIYFGTGEGWYNADAIRGLGIWKTTDGGATWNQLSSTNNATFYHIQKIVVDANGHIYVCTRNGGIQKSTNGGTTWTKVLGTGATAATDRAADLEIAANGDLYAAMGIFDQDGIYKSTTSGASWTKLTTGLPTVNFNRIELACAPSDANRVYALFQEDTTNNCSGIFRSDNGGTTWTLAGNPAAFGMTNFARGQGWYDLIAMVNPTNSSRLYIGGIDILVSDDAGVTFTQISQWYGGGGFQYAHADQHGFIFAPGSSSIAYFSNDGGLFRTTNANDGTLSNISMTERNTGFNVTQYYACAIHPQEGTPYFLAGSQDNGSQQYNGPGINTTTEVTGGDGAFCHIDEDEPSIQITSYVYNDYFITTNGFTSFNSVEFTDGGGGSIGLFINPTDYDSRSNTLYAAADPGDYLRWPDVAENTNEDIITVAAFGGAQVTHVSVSPNTENRVFFGLNNGRVVRVDNADAGSPSASHINSGAGMPFGSVSCIAIEEGDDDHLLVTFSNYGVESVWETTNGGTSWTNKEGNLPDMPVRWAILDPCDPTQALLATEMGVWSTTDLTAGSVDWGINDNDLPRVRTDMLQLRKSDGKLIAATHGRGLYSSDYFVKPSISYSATETTFQESSADGTEGACRGYREFDLTVNISGAPANSVTVNVVAGSNTTATNGDDYQIMTPTLTFNSGSTAAQTVTVRVYEDGEAEGTEILDLELDPTDVCDAFPGFDDIYRFIIEDAEDVPAGGVPYTDLLIDEDFDAGVQPAGWSTSTAGAGAGFGFGSAGALSAPYWPITDNGTNIAGMNDNLNPNSSDDRLIAPTIDLTHATAATVYFDAFFGGYTFNGFTETAFIEISTNGGITWDAYGIPGNFPWASYSVNLGAYLTESSVDINFRYNDNGGYLYGLAIDNVVVEADLLSDPSSIESTLNAEDTHELGPNATVHFYDTDGDIIATLKNNSAHDFGCTTVRVDRAGSTAMEFWYSGDVTKNVTSKTILATPTTNNASASVTATLYYSAAEVAGWEAATGKTWGSDAKIVKNPGAISNVTPGTPYPDGAIVEAVDAAGNLGTGADYFITATFTNGLSGFTAGDPGPAPPGLPVSLLDFQAKLYPDRKVELLWQTAQEFNNKHFEVQRSTDGVNFESLFEVPGKGNSNTISHYQSWDENPVFGKNLYRLKQVDLDGSFTLSYVVEVSIIPDMDLDKIRVFPNSFTDHVELFTKADLEGPLKVEWLTPGGKQLDVRMWDISANQQYLKIPVEELNLASGVYFLRLTTRAGEKKTFKLMKRE